MNYLHTQNPPIIYRDMKPAYIMLQPNGNIKLIDFGIAREYKEQNLADTVSLEQKDMLRRSSLEEKVRRMPEQTYIVLA